MTEPIEEVYFNWLYSKVASIYNRTPSLTYLKLLRTLHSIEFVWQVVGDDNRAEDGLDLRREFSYESEIVGDNDWYHLGCSVFEMLVAFSRRAEFVTETNAKEWFWSFLRHLGLNELNDAQHDIERQVIDATERLVWRTYSKLGKGGLFPLIRSKQDQRQVEIWYQFNEYLDDQRHL